MNHAIIFSLVVAVSVCVFHTFVYAEQCTVGTDCTTTKCNTGYHVICEHPAGDGVTANGGLCTCAVDNLNCTTKDDCIPLDMNCISDGHKHCYDNKCVCTRW